MFQSLLKDRIVAEPDFNRWKVPVASVAIHLCIGSVYAWSIFNLAFVKTLGVAASAADDWTLKDVVWIFTVAIVLLGLAAAVAGKWLERVGPRAVGVTAAGWRVSGRAEVGTRLNKRKSSSARSRLVARPSICRE